LVAQRQEPDQHSERRSHDHSHEHPDPRGNVMIDEQPGACVCAQSEVGRVTEAEHAAEPAHDVPADAHQGEDQHADGHRLLRRWQDEWGRNEDQCECGDGD